MKKSEKIEIRISYEEKEKLNRLAESEGRSVSELVRDLAKKYALLNMPNPRHRLSLWAVAGFILCGLGIGVGVTMSLTNQPDRHYVVSGNYDGNLFGVKVPKGRSFSQVLNLNDQFEAHVSVPARRTNQMAKINVCEVVVFECLPVQEVEIRLKSDDVTILRDDRMEIISIPEWKDDPSFRRKIVEAMSST